MNPVGTEAKTEPDPITAAIEALTAAASGTRIIGRGTPNEHREPVDLAEIVCQVITAVAANVGGVEMLLAGRPGSWEADYVRQIVHSTAGHEEADLLRFRLEPVRLVVDFEGTFYDFGLETMWDQEREQAIEREQNDSLTEEQIVEASALVDAINELWDRDKAAYNEAYTATVHQVLTARGLTCGVEVTEASLEVAATWEPLADELDAAARMTSPLPMTGKAPDWTNGTPADALRRAGLTYTARALKTLRRTTDRELD
ncbi:hypothetical protein ABDK96_15630 [Citricoccus nitrophenolicus]|uniref:Uncharacterized protein n=1 Tax=Citricoccus nitrophenolicus TaxID=863575 RepID=A0ABV0INR6_9MICC